MKTESKLLDVEIAAYKKLFPGFFDDESSKAENAKTAKKIGNFTLNEAVRAIGKLSLEKKQSKKVTLKECCYKGYAIHANDAKKAKILQHKLDEMGRLLDDGSSYLDCKCWTDAAKHDLCYIPKAGIITGLACMKSYQKHLHKEMAKIIEYDDVIFQKPILDKAERAYVEAVIAPFKGKVKSIFKKSSEHAKGLACLTFKMNGNRNFHLPWFKASNMYRGMSLCKEYSLDELDLLQGGKE
mgnify:FL=1